MMCQVFRAWQQQQRKPQQLQQQLAALAASAVASVAFVTSLLLRVLLLRLLRLLGLPRLFLLQASHRLFPMRIVPLTPLLMPVFLISVMIKLWVCHLGPAVHMKADSRGCGRFAIRLWLHSMCPREDRCEQQSTGCGELHLSSRKRVKHRRARVA